MADRRIISGRNQAMAAVQGLYQAMTSFSHEPFFLVCHDVADGWDMIG
jgi:hypothetical protein